MCVLSVFRWFHIPFSQCIHGVETCSMLLARGDIKLEPFVTWTLVTGVDKLQNKWNLINTRHYINIITIIVNRYNLSFKEPFYLRIMEIGRERSTMPLYTTYVWDNNIIYIQLRIINKLECFTSKFWIVHEQHFNEFRLTSYQPNNYNPTSVWTTHTIYYLFLLLFIYLYILPYTQLI